MTSGELVQMQGLGSEKALFYNSPAGIPLAFKSNQIRSP